MGNIAPRSAKIATRCGNIGPQSERERETHRHTDTERERERQRQRPSIYLTVKPWSPPELNQRLFQAPWQKMVSEWSQLRPLVIWVHIHGGIGINLRSNNVRRFTVPRIRLSSALLWPAFRAFARRPFQLKWAECKTSRFPPGRTELRSNRAPS